MVGQVLGATLTLVLAALVLAALIVAWRRPYLALPILVGGMAVHNAAVMVMLGAGVPDVVIRCLQLWKEALLALLAFKLALGLVRSGLRPTLSTTLKSWRSASLAVRLLDSGVALFAVLLVVYTVVPVVARDSQATIAQRVLELRQLGLIPALYLFGRVWPPANLRLGLGPIVVAAIVVTVIGLIELFFIPTHTWLDLGIVKFDSLQGYQYTGPGGIPENFFQSTTAGLLRRMVSTYLSPLGISYTGILVIPITFIVAVSSGRRRRYAWLALALVLVGMSLSLTRLALFCIVLEAIVLFGLRLRRSGLLAAGAIVMATAFGLLVYPSFGPVVTFNLEDARPPLGLHVLQVVSNDQPTAVVPPPGNVTSAVVNALATGDDSSIQTHLDAMASGLRFVAAHPLGVGLGTSVTRYGTASGPNESAMFAIGADTGALGLVLFLALYGGLVLVGLSIVWRRRDDVALCALGAVVGVGGLALAPVVLTSQVWGNFSVTFLFWWAAGSVVAAVAAGYAPPKRQDTVSEVTPLQFGAQ